MRSALSMSTTLQNSSFVSPYKVLNTFQIPMAKCLFNHFPVFPLLHSQVKILHKPKDFYNELLQQAKNSKKRIIFSSLYVGTGNLEQKLISVINDQLLIKPELRVKWLLDFTRASRGSINSRTMLSPHIKENSCEVSLYHTPALRGLLKHFVPDRWNETVGLQHMKIYVFDDSTIISGANLSEDYFSNRQDRYIIIENCAPLAQFYEDLINVVSSHSFVLDSSNKTKMPHKTSVHPFMGNYNEYCSSIGNSLNKFWLKQKDNSREAFAAAESENKEFDTVVLPTLQMASFGFTLDSQLTKLLLEGAPAGSHFHLATGYFNLTNEYINSILKVSQASYDVTCAHPEANGFLGAKGIAGSIPAAYTDLCKSFFYKVSQLRQQGRISIREYLQNGWTFHAKGLWYFAPRQQFPSCTLIGSPNFGYRSVHRDLETQLLIATRNEDLREEMFEEQHRLQKFSYQVTKKTFQEPRRIVPIWVKLFTIFMKKYF